MFSRRSILIAAASALPLITLSNKAAAVSSEWIPVKDDLSRKDLFQIELAANVRDYGPLTTQIQESNALDSYFNFPNDVEYDYKFKKKRTNSNFGLDISHWQGAIDFSRLKSQGVKFIFHKASQGSRGYDAAFANNWALLSTLAEVDRIPKGAYHFLTPDAGGSEQADHYMEVVMSSGGWAAGDLVPVVDVESTTKDPKLDTWRRKSPDEIVKIISDFMARISSKMPKSKPIIYTGRSWWSVVEPTLKVTDLALPAELSSYRLWIADYGRKSEGNEIPRVLANATTILWQFTSTASVSTGFDGDIDASVFYGNEEQFRAQLTM